MPAGAIKGGRASGTPAAMKTAAVTSSEGSQSTSRGRRTALPPPACGGQSRHDQQSAGQPAREHARPEWQLSGLIQRQPES